MDAEAVPNWFRLGERATSETMQRIAGSIQELPLPLQVKFLPIQAHWFIGNSLFLANRANRDGMHANALALTRQCLEAISIVELGLTSNSGAADVLLRWERDEMKPGALRAWLEANVWQGYGSGLWTEPWSDFMRQLAGAIQPYAHYTSRLQQWQAHFMGRPDPAKPNVILMRIAPNAYDPQKATRITLYHAILTYALARIWIASHGQDDTEFAALINRLGRALGSSNYLDGHETNWEQQFWAMVWSMKSGSPILE